MLWAGLAPAQPPSMRPLPPHIIIPQVRIAPEVETAVVDRVSAQVNIQGRRATTSLAITLRNPGASRLEAELVMPIPEGAAVQSFSFDGLPGNPSAELLPRHEARRLYQSIVSKLRDPALLEFAGYNLVRSSLFPIEPGQTQTLHLTYEQLLPADGARIDYALPRSESIDYLVPWHIEVKLDSPSPISTVYSPSHPIEVRRGGPRSIEVLLPETAARNPGAFRLSYLVQTDGPTASVFACPDARATQKASLWKAGGDSGFFLLLMGLPAEIPGAKRAAIKREVTMVVDRSGSMNGEKMAQVREAALQVIGGLEPNETFNLIVYNEGVDRFAAAPVNKNDRSVAEARQYLAGIQPRGGTNIHDALIQALAQPPSEGMLPLVLFLTDGLPTIGETSEKAIREAVRQSNPHARRVFTFGAGVDVNTPLLTGIASDTRGTATFVLPDEDVELKVAQVFRRLSGPLLSDPILQATTSSGEPAPGRISDAIPAQLPDIFEDDQLIVLGRYMGAAPLSFQLSGNYLGKPRTFTIALDPAEASTQNNFVARLWASRKIGALIEAVRDLGGDGNLLESSPVYELDPRMKELVDEIVRLSMEFGILTEYTAFLAREGRTQPPLEEVRTEALNLFTHRAVNVRSGLGSVNQDRNLINMKGQQNLDYFNTVFDEQMNPTQLSGVQQIADMAFFRRGGQWVQGRVVEQPRSPKPHRLVEFGSPAFFDLAEQLAREGRQAAMALSGEILIEVDREIVLVKNP